MGWDVSPSLFIAVNGFYGDPKQLSHLLLGFFQLFPEIGKLFTFQTEVLSFFCQFVVFPIKIVSIGGTTELE